MPTLDNLYFSGPTEMCDSNAAAVDPFEDDCLLEAQILEIRYDGIRSVLGIILEMRLAERITEASTGLIVASGISNYSWKQIDRRNMRTAWTVIGSSASRTSAGIAVELITSPSAALTFTADAAAFYSLQIENLETAAPPDYVEQDISVIREGIANWSSDAKVVYVVHCR
ncbi:hypothetical protein A5733_22800 [Mycobacterium sp. NS-7484]|uniref:hypothetical protein n=1 Tax=Mycobacterium sp. NS-7484 TaxID=1834161 RepID=UPI00096F34E7|nr:hypothetical protein [Mycobacterium sp. NS-7484]OMC03918.1 hypothetical protein A5733_22800 [Mycobacterium sp. NS-7484]